MQPSYADFVKASIQAKVGTMQPSVVQRSTRQEEGDESNVSPCIHERLDMARVLIAIEYLGSINDIVHLSVDNKDFTIRVNEELLGANFFKHMEVYNVVGHGISSRVVVSERGRPSSPSASPVQTHDDGSKIQSFTPAPISSYRRRLTEDLNGEARQLEAIEGSVGSLSKAIAVCAGEDEERAGRSYLINDKICPFDGKTGVGSYLADLGLSVSGKGGEIQQNDLGRRSDGGPMLVLDGRSELEAEEDLGFVAGPFELQEEVWMGLGKNSYQHKEAGESGKKPLFLEQLSLISSSRIRKARISSKSGGYLSKSNMQKWKKASQKKGRKKIPRLRIASRSPP
ncbi:hypothetical protein Ancab_019005 [Ancistrocladus abbreviatus]